MAHDFRIKGSMSKFSTITDFTPDCFTATKWDNAEKKTTFARQFIKFVRSDFAKSQFPKTFYTRLSGTFGHIAHYNQGGFYDEFFTTTEDKVRFLLQTMQHPCYGDPEYTYGDVERASQPMTKSEVSPIQNTTSHLLTPAESVWSFHGFGHLPAGCRYGDNLSLADTCRECLAFSRLWSFAGGMPVCWKPLTC
jgi:hypothetical protein